MTTADVRVTGLKSNDNESKNITGITFATEINYFPRYGSSFNNSNSYQYFNTKICRSLQ